MNRGSNPRGAATSGDVVKWFNTEVCKTSIHRFESCRRLHLSVITRVAVALGIAASAASCGGASPSPSPSTSASPALSATDLHRIVGVPPTTPGWGWPTEPIVQPPPPSMEPSASHDTPGPTDADPLAAELERQMAIAGGVVAADGSRWQDEQKLGVTYALLLTNDAGARIALAAQRAFQRGWVERTLGDGQFTDLPVDGLGDQAWRVQSDFPGGQQATLGWRRARLVLQIHIQCIFRTCPSDIGAAARAWADAMDKEAAASH